MSKQKTPETEKEVTENLVEQSELEGLDSKSKNIGLEEVAASIPEIEKPEKLNVKLEKFNPGISVKANKTGKMGVYKFLMLYPQDVYMETLLKFYYPRSFFTKDEWFRRIEDILNTPILH